MDAAPVPPKGKEGAGIPNWADVLRYWAYFQMDCLEFYGIDLASGVLKERTLRWFNNLVRDVALRPDTRLVRAVRLKSD